jgi:hypothetical protein
MMENLRRIVRDYGKDGEVEFEYNTRVFYGRL